MVTETIKQREVHRFYNDHENWIECGISSDAVSLYITQWMRNYNKNYSMVRNKEDNMKQPINKW